MIRINEDFFDDNILDSPVETPEYGPDNGTNQFSLHLMFHNMPAAVVARTLKRKAYFILNNTAFHDVSIDGISLDISTDKGVVYDAIGIPDSIYGIPVEIDSRYNALQLNRTYIYGYMEFSAKAVFRTPKEIYDTLTTLSDHNEPVCDLHIFLDENPCPDKVKLDPEPLGKGLKGAFRIERTSGDNRFYGFQLLRFYYIFIDSPGMIKRLRDYVIRHDTETSAWTALFDENFDNIINENKD